MADDKKNEKVALAKRIQKNAFKDSNFLSHMIDDIRSVVDRKYQVKSKRDICSVPQIIEGTVVVKSRLQLKQAEKKLKSALENDVKRTEILKQGVKSLLEKQSQIEEYIERINHRYENGIKSKELNKLETLNKLTDYVETSLQVKLETEKQEFLLKLGSILESTQNELAIYEEVLGEIATKDGGYFLNKGETLITRRKILSRRRNKIINTYEDDSKRCEEIKKSIFKLNFENRDITQNKFNLINKLSEIGIKSTRAVLDLEAKHEVMRAKAYEVKAENAWLHWFLNWVLFDVIGQDLLKGITEASSPSEKASAIIDFYKSLRSYIMKNEEVKRVDIFT